MNPIENIVSAENENIVQQISQPLEPEAIQMDYHKSKKVVDKVKKTEQAKQQQKQQQQQQQPEEQFVNKYYYNQKEMSSGKKKESNKNDQKFSEIQKNQDSFSLKQKEEEEDAVSIFESEEGNDLINDFGVIGQVNENSQIHQSNKKEKVNEQQQQQLCKNSSNLSNQYLTPSKEHELESSSASNKVAFSSSIFIFKKKKNLSINTKEQASSSASPQPAQKQTEDNIQPAKSKKVNKFFDMREKDQQIQEQENNKQKQTAESNLQKQADLLDFHFNKKLVDSPKQQQFMGSMDKMKKNAQFFQNLNADLKQKELPPLNERTVKNFQKMKEIEQERIREQQELQRQHNKINQFQQFMNQAIYNPQQQPLQQPIQQPLQRQFYGNQFGRPLGMNQYNQYQGQPNDEDVEELVYQLDENGFLMDEQGNYLQDEFGKRVKLSQEELDNLRAQNLIEEEEI